MREIKFRAWDRVHKFMIQSREIKEVSSSVLQDDEHTILMQYTGLKDKNGVEIYEGDILEGRRGRHVVEWSIYGWGLRKGNRVYTMGVGNTGQDEWDEECKMHNFKVVGNIYENPELLKK